MKTRHNIHGQGTIQRGATGKKVDDFYFEVAEVASGEHKKISIEAFQAREDG